jgi:signal transduction histidine kinase
VDVKAAALNPVDYKKADFLPTFLLRGSPAAQDFAGVIAASASPDFAVGDAVFGTAPGCLAERLRAPDDGGDGRITPPLSRIVLSADGGTIPVLVSASTARSEHHETAVLFFFQDQREQLRIRSALEETQQRLDASEKQAILAELAGAAAHELNQPLTSVLGYAELLTRKLGADDPTRRPLEVIHREASRMAEIVKQIGQITRYETTAYVGSTRILDLAASAGAAPPAPKPGETP